MPLRAIYANSTGSNVDISARIRAYQMSITQYAEQGSVGMSQLEVDDPEGGINILGLRGIRLTEESEGSNQQTIGRFFTADRDIVRHESLRTGSARLWRINMTDPNSIITRRIMRGSDANRPAETDVQRVQWLMTTSELGGVLTNSRYVSTAFPVAMDAVDYRDQSNQQILDDCGQASGKNYFAFWDEPVSAYGLFYDFPGSSAYRSAIRISNILGLVDNDIVFGAVDPDTKLNRDPSRVYSGVILPFTGGEVYVQNATTGDEFYRRDTTAPAVNVKTTAKATARANRYLDDIRTEADVISTAIVVPTSKVNHLQVGQAVQCWFSHFPGYDTGWNWMRVLTRTITATSEEFYTVEVELATAIGGLYNGPGSVTFPPVPIVEATPPQSCVAVNGLTFDYTQAGTRTGLGPGTFSGSWLFATTDFLQYVIPGDGFAGSDYPSPGQLGSWGNGGVNNCVLTSGGADYTGGGSFARAQITVIGPGHLQVLTAQHPNAACGLTTAMTAILRASGSTPIITTDSQAPGTPLNITVPNDGYCAHYVTITGDHALGLRLRDLDAELMKVTNFGDAIPLPLAGWSTGYQSIGSNADTNPPLSAQNFVQRITANTSNTLLNPIVNFASGSGVTFAVASNTLTISGGSGSANFPGAVVSHGAMGATETLDYSQGTYHYGTLDANCTISFTGWTNAKDCGITFEVTENGTGGWTPTFSGVTWLGGTTPTHSTTLGTTTIYEFFSRDGGSTIVGGQLGGSSSGITIKDEGSSLATAATSLDFVGAGVVASGATAAKTITINGTTVVMASGGGPPDPVLTSDGLDWVYSS